MTAVYDIFLVCDSCQVSSAAVSEGARSAGVAREDAKAGGWHYGRGRDICDTCWEDGKR